MSKNQLCFIEIKYNLEFLTLLISYLFLTHLAFINGE